MRAILSLACSSAWNRRFVLALIAASIALSAFLLLTLERVRADVRASFAQSVSGADLIVGPRTGQLQLLLYTVFRIGTPANNVRWDSAEAIGAHPQVAWWVPVSLGDSYRGYPVLATTPEYFDHFRYGARQPLVLEQGARFSRRFDAVLGADVAQALGLRLGDRITLSHGSAAIEGHDHGERPFTVAGILQRTGTPVDRTLHVSMEATKDLHAGWIGGIRLPGHAPAKQDHARHAHGAHEEEHPEAVTAVLVGLKRRAAAFSVQRDVAEFADEPLMAILPGVALDELWQVAGGAERALQGVSALVAVASLAGLVAVVMAGLEQRRRELAILRAIGAGPRHMLQLLCAEGLLVTLAGVVAGAALHWAAIALLADTVRTRFGISLTLGAPGTTELLLLAALVACGFAASLLPGVRAYRLSLADGLSPRT